MAEVLMTTEQSGFAETLGRLIPAPIRNLGPLFFLTVALPTFLATLYFGLIAADVYVSESRYVVRTQSKTNATGLASLLIGAEGAAGGGGEGPAAADFIVSRDAMAALNTNNRLVSAYTRPEIDFFGGLDGFAKQHTSEDLFRYFTRHVAVEQDSRSGITTLVVKAYRTDDAQWINERLLQLAEGLVNQLNQRSRDDMVRFARKEVAEARDEAQRTRLALARFQIQNGVVDPEKQAQVSLEMISKLQDEIILSKTQLAQMLAFTPRNPQIPVLRERIKSLNSEIEREMQKVVGNNTSLAAKGTEYTKLMVEAEIAGKYLATTLISLQNATNDARRQQAYVQRIVQPSKPDEAAYPKRLRSIFSVLVLGLVVWGVLTLLLSAMREHRQ